MKSLVIGLMSGTSGDGVSIALAAFSDRSFDLLAYKTYPYPKPLSRKLSASSELKSRDISMLNFTLGRFFSGKLSQFIRDNRIAKNQVKVIGSHGHTVFHGPDDNPPHTLQIGEPSFLSQATGIPTVSDFRSRDIAAGGEGAPLIPFFDQFFYGRGSPRALQNIGGIANVTVVGKNVESIAFDTGPGNCLIDWAVQKMTNGRKRYDASGRLATLGKIDMAAVRQMASNPYFKKRPPKSSGRELFNERFISRRLFKGRLIDTIATLTFFTAYTIWNSYRSFVPQHLSEIIVSGGGALNKTLMNHLSKLFSPTPVCSIEEFSVPAQAKEPIAFAFFALRALEGKSNRLPVDKNSRGNLILGKIIPGHFSNNKTES